MHQQITRALRTKVAHGLFARGLRFKSTPRQVQNGTIVLAGRVDSKYVEYKITANGFVLSNDFVVRDVGELQYRAGLIAAEKLLTKRTRP